MAPRAPEPKDAFLKRFAAAVAAGRTEIRFGAPHLSHAAVLEDGTWRVRRLVFDPAKGEAYLKEHGMFMPEHAEMLSEPTGESVLEAATADELARLLAAHWPLDGARPPAR